jgi:hypothetical protein
MSLINVALQQGRQVDKPELEFGIISAQEALSRILISIESSQKRLPSSLKVSELTGVVIKTKVAVLSAKGIVDQENVDCYPKINDEFDKY